MDIIQWDNKSERDRIEKIKDMDKEFIFNTNKKKLFYSVFRK